MKKITMVLLIAKESTVASKDFVKDNLKDKANRDNFQKLAVRSCFLDLCKQVCSALNA